MNQTTNFRYQQNQCCFVFFFQAEDGIRGLYVTGVQTCALPICPLSVAPSRIKSPITPFTPRELTSAGVERQIRAFARCAALAREAGYDGVEVMGSEEIGRAACRERVETWCGIGAVDREAARVCS